MGPQNRVSDRSREPQDQEGSRRQDPPQQRGKKTVTERQSSESPESKKHKSTDSDEDDEEPQNDSRTSSNSRPTGLVLPYNSGDEDSEFSDEYSNRSQDSGRTVFYPDLYVLTIE